MKTRTNIYATFLLLGCVAFSAEASYTGHVFIDKNRNGIFDKGEKPLSGVIVSDGLHVVRTARDGSFDLPGHEKERFIFITTPSGFKTDNAYYRLMLIIAGSARKDKRMISGSYLMKPISEKTEAIGSCISQTLKYTVPYRMTNIPTGCRTFVIMPPMKKLRSSCTEGISATRTG